MRNATWLSFVVLLAITAVHANGISPATEPSYARIEWSKPYQKNDLVFVPGMIKASFGNFSILWKIGPKNLVQLITLDTSSGAEKRPREVHLLLWQSEDGKFTTIFIERYSLLNQVEPPRLQKITTVKTVDLNTGLNSGLELAGY